MRGKILLVLGLGIGYVLGTRDGRARYNQMKSAALKVWNDPRVQEQVNAATEFVKENAPEVASALTENVKKIAQRVEAARSGKAPAKSATPARKPAAKPVSKKTTPSAPTNNAKK
ncbi:MAG: hypothetical protein RLZZ441_405 [Actinomycetota bacterium]